MTHLDTPLLDIRTLAAGTVPVLSCTRANCELGGLRGADKTGTAKRGTLKPVWVDGGHSR